jgi:hypothetical protein
MNINRQLTPYNHSNGRFGAKVVHVDLHTMVGSIGSAQARFFSPTGEASAHYGISLNGEQRQWVSEGDTAWHAGNWPENIQSIGIEHEDGGNYNDPVRTDALYNASIELVTDICRRYSLNSTSIHVHNEFKATGCPDGLDVARIRNGVAAALAGLQTAAPANPHIETTPATGTVEVTVDVLRVRTGPGLNFAGGQANTPDGALHQGVVVGYAGWVIGDGVDGCPVWLKSVRGNFFWAGGTNFNWQAVVPKAAPAATPAPVAPPAAEPVQSTPEPAPVAPEAPAAAEPEVPAVPDWHESYAPDVKKLVSFQDYTVKDLDEFGQDVELKRGMIVNQAGTFTKDGVEYARTDSSVKAKVFYGIPTAILQDYVPTAAQVKAPATGIGGDIRPGRPAAESNFDGLPDWANFKKSLSPRDRIVATLAAIESVAVAVGRKLKLIK